MAVAPKYHRYRLKCKNPRCGVIFPSWSKRQATCSRSCGAQCRRASTGPNSPRESGMRGGMASRKRRHQEHWNNILTKWPTIPTEAQEAIRLFLNLRYLAGRKSGERSGFAAGFAHALGERAQMRGGNEHTA